MRIRTPLSHPLSLSLSIPFQKDGMVCVKSTWNDINECVEMMMFTRSESLEDESVSQSLSRFPKNLERVRDLGRSDRFFFFEKSDLFERVMSECVSDPQGRISLLLGTTSTYCSYVVVLS